MKGSWSEHFPTAADKPNKTKADTSPGKMKGLWSEHFPTDDKPAVEPPRYQRCLLCPMCNAASCRLWTSKTDKNPGRQFYKCPASDHKFFKWADEVKPNEFIDVPDCGGCSAGVCRVRREKSGPNAGRIMFMCRVKEGEGSCGYRVWQDELEMAAMARADERISSSQSSTINCNGTIAINTGLVDETKQTDDRVWPDDPEMSARARADERISSSQSSTVNCNGNIAINTGLVKGTEQTDEVANTVSPMIDASEHFQCCEVTSRTMCQVKYLQEKPNESSRRPKKRSRYGDVKAVGSLISGHFLTIRLALNTVPNEHCWMADAIRQNLSTQLHGWWGRLAFHPMPCLMTCVSKQFTCSIASQLDSTFVVQGVLVNTNDSTTIMLEQSHNALDSSSLVQDKIDSTKLARSLLGAESDIKPLFTPGQLNAELLGCVAFDVPSCSDPFHDRRHQNVMSKAISNVFCQAAECLQNDLLNRLETMGVKDHEAMTQEAEDTFAALDRLLFDHQDFKKRVKELIHCASLLAQIEQSMPTNDSYQKLVEHCSSERLRLDEISYIHAKAIDAVTNNKKRLKVLQEEISSTMDWLFQIEAEVSCCEVEMGNKERELEQISKDKEVLEGKYLIASKEREESQKLLEQKEAKCNAAKAAFDRARALLRG